MSEHIIVLFYKFVSVAEPESLRDAQRALCKELGIKGRLLIAKEGVNGTFEGMPEQIDAYKAAWHAIPEFADLKFKESKGTGQAFSKIDIKVRDEVVTLGAGEFDIQKETSREMTAEELEALYESGEEFTVLDLRNDYEIQVGQFEKTEHPNLRNFRDLPEKLAAISHLKKKKVVAVCTGGIRCEKATCLLEREGFEDLYQLKDGIHTYMQKFPSKHFKGTLFVFDNRMVTPVVEALEREIVGRCFECDTPCEDVYSNDNFRPSLKVICCKNCIAKHTELRTA